MSDPACFQSAVRSRHVTLSRFKKQTAVTYLYTTKNRLTYIQIKIINLIQTILNKVEEKNKREIIERKKSKQKDFVKFGLEYFVINKFWKEKSWCKIFVQAKI